MRILFNKFTKTCIEIILFGIIACGMVNAQNICCNEELYSCNPTFKRAAYADAANNISSKSLLHSKGNRERSCKCSKKILRNFGPGQECCENDCSENYTKAAYVHTTISQVVNPYQLNEIFGNLQKGIDAKFEALSQPRTTLSVPIYILTLSIIC